jgi:hypothetical protein
MVHNASTSEAINAAANAAGVNADELANRLAVYGATNREAVGICLDSMLPTSGSNWFEATKQRSLVEAGREAFSSQSLSASAVARAAATEPLNPHSKLMQLTADAVNARNAAAAAFAAESGVVITNAAPFCGGWSFFAHCVRGGEDKGAAVMAAIRRLGFVPSRHEVNDRLGSGATFYAKPE